MKCEKHKLPALALVIFLSWPALARAAWLGFRNDLPVPVALQASMVVNNAMTSGRPIRLLPGESTMECLINQASRWISIYDTKNANRLLLQQKIQCKQDVFYSIRFQPPNQVKLVETKFPARLPNTR
jgi:hypothetical protein